jgi:hypothetical protein
MNKALIFIFLLLFQGKAFAVHIDLIKGSEQKVCHRYFGAMLTLNSTNQREIFELIDEFQGIPSWESGSIHLKPTNSDYPARKEAFSHAQFDIDNDGEDELVLSAFTWLRQRPGMYYRILDESVPLDGSYETEWKNIYDLDGIYSNTPWPYADDGIYLANISAFKYEGIFYVVLTDIFFGQREHIDRSLLIAKYSNQMKEEYLAKGTVTSSLENVCVFQYVQ